MCGELIDACREGRARASSCSRSTASPRCSGPIHINRVLREAGLLKVRTRARPREARRGRRREAFAVADHQIAHVYVQNARARRRGRALLGAHRRRREGARRGRASARTASITPRSGELVAIAAADNWFSYYYWLDDAQAPDYARTVDIHRKPGYDPAELFVDPRIAFPALKIGRSWRKKPSAFACCST